MNHFPKKYSNNGHPCLFHTKLKKYFLNRLASESYLKRSSLAMSRCFIIEILRIE
jgi:hypothetical protein